MNGCFREINGEFTWKHRLKSARSPKKRLLQNAIEGYKFHSIRLSDSHSLPGKGKQRLANRVCPTSGK